MKLLVSGLGNLGLPLALALQDAGYEVVGTDVWKDARDRAQAAGLQAPLPDEVDAAAIGVHFVIVPTPSRDDGTFDPSSVIVAALRLSGPGTGSVVAVVSTLLPAQLREVEEAVGRHVVYCPEFVRLGFVREDMADPSMILVGSDDADAAILVARILRTLVLDPNHIPVLHLSLTEAAIAKIAVNTMVCAKISAANMIGEVCEALGADPGKVCRAVGHDLRIGHSYFRPGGAYGGPCFPRDTAAFVALAASVEVGAEIADAAERINRRQLKPFPEVPGRGY